MPRSLFLLLALSACKKSTTVETKTAGPRTLHIAALNDFHGALYEELAYKDPTRAYGGLPWLHAAVDTLRAEHPDLLLLDGGDIFQGSWPVNATKGRGAVEAYNLLGVDAAAVGNHEFDYGGLPGEHPLRGALEVGGRLATYDWLAANIDDEQGPWAPEGFAPWVVIERSGIKVGIIGLSTQDTPQTTLLKHVVDLTFRDVVATVEREVPKMREAGAEVIIGVGHLSGKCDPQEYESITGPCEPTGEVGRLAESGLLDVLIAGHAHSLLHHRIGNTFVLEQRAKGHAIGLLDLVVTADGVDPEASDLKAPWFLSHAPVDPGCEDRPFPTDPIDVGGRSLTPSAEALALVDRLEQEAGSLCDRVGCTTAPLGRTRSGQSEVGDLMADMMLAAMPADVALTNSGGLRADLPQGDLRREHLQMVMPFDNRLVKLEMSGAQLEKVMRIGSSGGHGILQIAGGTYHFDPERTGGDDLDADGEVAEWERNRLCGVEVGGAPLDPEKTYTVVTTDFLHGGGDHLGPALSALEIQEEGPLLRDAMNTWFEAQDTCYTPSTAVRIRQGACE